MRWGRRQENRAGGGGGGRGGSVRIGDTNKKFPNS